MSVKYEVKSRYSKGIVKIELLLLLLYLGIFTLAGILELFGVHNYLGKDTTVLRLSCFAALFILFLITYALTSVWKLDIADSKITYTDMFFRKHYYDIKDITVLKQVKYFTRNAVAVYIDDKKIFTISSNCMPGYVEFMQECSFYGKKVL